MSSNDGGDEPRVTPPVSSRQRPNRPAAGAQRVDNDPRSDPATARVNTAVTGNNGSVNGNGSIKNNENGKLGAGLSEHHSPDNVVALDANTTNPKRPSRRAKPQGAHESSTTVDDLAPTSAPPPPDSGSSPISPLTIPVASPVTSPVVVVPVSDLVPGVASPAPRPPAARAPAGVPYPVPHVVPLPPSVFDDDGRPTGAMPFDALFDPDADPAGLPRRQRAVQFTQTGRRRRPRFRRVTRVVRHVDPWSVFKVALCFSLVLYGVCLTAGVLLWNVAYTTGTIDNVQRFFESFGWNTFRFKGGELFHNAWIAGLFAALALTGLIVLAVTLFNLITDLVGGIRVTVLEEEVVERSPVVRGPLLRRRTRPVSMITPEHDLGDDHDSAHLHGHLG